MLIIQELHNESNNRFKLNLYARIKCETNLILAKLPGWSDIRITEELQLIKFPRNSAEISSRDLYLFWCYVLHNEKIAESIVNEIDSEKNTRQRYIRKRRSSDVSLEKSFLARYSRCSERCVSPSLNPLFAISGVASASSRIPRCGPVNRISLRSGAMNRKPRDRSTRTRKEILLGEKFAGSPSGSRS